MKYQYVSADSHIDLSWLPGDLFAKNGPAHLKDVLPKVVETPNGSRWISEGKELGVYGGLGFTFIAPKQGGSLRVDRMYQAGYYDGQPHPVNPDLRLKDMQIDGVDAEILYGLSTVATIIKSPEVLTAIFRVYNEWVASFCKKQPERWFGLACIPLHDPKVAAEEVTRAAKLGLRGIDLDPSVAPRPMYLRDGTWDALWRAAAEAKMPIAFHITSDKMKVPPAPAQDASGKPLSEEAIAQNQLAYQGTRGPLGQLAGAEWISTMAMNGSCDKFPDLRYVLGESGAGWIPFVLERLDLRFYGGYMEKKMNPPLKMRPSDYWRKHGATTFQEDPSVAAVAHLIGEDNLMWGSDYPHPDGVWPDSHKTVERLLGKLDKKVQKKIVCDNAVRLYHLN
jgi:predicted TIM-barrel fold metal-dependent hydrolase